MSKVKYTIYRVLGIIDYFSVSVALNIFFTIFRVLLYIKVLREEMLRRQKAKKIASVPVFRAVTFVRASKK